jgi:FkbM family methyltransferase
VGGGRLSLEPSYYPDFAIFRDIYLRQVYRTDYRGAYVLDLGSHKGYFAVYALMHDAKMVECFEPSSRNFAALRQTVASTAEFQNRVRLHQAAVGARDGLAQLHVYERSWSHSLIERPDARQTCVEQVAIREFAGVLEACPPEDDARIIVKMDIEGAECDVLLNTALESLTRMDELFLETHTFGPCDRQCLINRMEQIGFTARRMQDPDVFHFQREQGQGAVRR